MPTTNKTKQNGCLTGIDLSDQMRVSQAFTSLGYISAIDIIIIMLVCFEGFLKLIF